MRKYFILLSIIVIIAACDLSSYNPTSSYPSPTPTPESTTIPFVPDTNGDVRFFTNDAFKFCGTDGSTVWELGDSSYTGETPMNKIVVDVTKIDGNSGKGFGIIFCAQDEFNFLALLIDIEGFFMPIRCSNRLIEYLEPNWTYSDKIQTGKNLINQLQIVYGGNNDFKVSFNGTEVKTVVINNAPFFTGGRYGYIVCIGNVNDEKFPDNPVDVRFRQITPVDIGFKLESNILQRSLCKKLITMNWSIR